LKDTVLKIVAENEKIIVTNINKCDIIIAYEYRQAVVIL